jgi:hypothetical protein
MPSEFDISGDPELANLVGPGLPLRRSTPFSPEEVAAMRERVEATRTDSPSEYGNTQISSGTNEPIPSVGKLSSKTRGKNGGKKSRTRRNKKRQIRRKTNKRYSRRR